MLTIKIINKIEHSREYIWPFGEHENVLIVENKKYSRWIPVPEFDDPDDELFWLSSTLQFLGKKIEMDLTKEE